MKFKKFTALLLAALLVLSLAACGTKDNDKKADMSSNDSAMTGEPKNAEEALALHKKLMEQENTILSQNTALWEKVFMAADKGMTLQELQQVFVEQGCKVAYNLDGGGSATMILGSQRVNKTSGSRERDVSDIVYFTK